MKTITKPLQIVTRSNIMKPNIYNIVRDAVEAGTIKGIRRAHKHEDDPTHDAIESEVVAAILLEFDHYFTFDIPALDR